MRRSAPVARMPLAAAAAVVAIIGGLAVAGTWGTPPSDNPHLQPAANLTSTPAPSNATGGFGSIPHCPAEYHDPNTGYNACAIGTPPSASTGQVTLHYHPGD
jgi:hypothetical protein